MQRSGVPSEEQVQMEKKMQRKSKPLKSRASVFGVSGDDKEYSLMI